MSDDSKRYYLTKKCAVCKKVFVITPEWVYKRGKSHEKTYWYCSWKCLRADERPKRKKGNPKSEHADEICQMITDGYTTRQICDQLGVEAATVKYWRTFGELKGESGYYGDLKNSP